MKNTEQKILEKLQDINRNLVCKSSTSCCVVQSGGIGGGSVFTNGGGKVLAGLTSRRAKESDIYFKKIDE